jgi:hypothetical protein
LASSFINMSPTGPAHPDFSPLGAPLSFGLVTSTTYAPEIRGHLVEVGGGSSHDVEYESVPVTATWGSDNFSITIHPVAMAATHFSVVAPTSVGAGSSFTVNVTALDGFNYRDYGYHGAVRFSCTDPAATPPSPNPYTFTTGPRGVGDNGIRPFTVVLQTAGPQTITFTDTVDPGIFGFVIVNVIPDVAISLDVTVGNILDAGILDAGVARDITVTALDRFRNVASGYHATVHFQQQNPDHSSDRSALLPPDYTFTTGPGADNGRHRFPNGVTLFTAGPQTIKVSDNEAPPLSRDVPVLVVPGPAVKFIIADVPPTLVAGTASDVRPVAKDAYGPRDGNTATSYRGTVHFTSSDGAATLPHDYAFNDDELYPGSHLFRNGLILRTPGDQTVTVTDTVTGITGTIHVTVTPAPRFQVEVVPGVTPGVPFDIVVTVRDAFGNIDVNYRGTVSFSATDPDTGVVLPTDYTFTADDAGVHTFPGAFTLVTPGEVVITLRDADNGFRTDVTVWVDNVIISVPPAEA